MTRRKIIWKYWQSPFGENDLEYVDESEAEVKSEWDNNDDSNKSIKIRPVIATAMGFMPVQPFQSFTESFEFWMGHTNFNITQEVKDKIEVTPGVEILDILTRYCFRIAVGKAFDGKEVKLEIQKKLDAMPPKKGEINPTDMKLDKDTQDKVLLLKSTIKQEFPYWVIYVIPNGEIDVAGANTQDGYEMHLNLYKSAQELAGGVIYQYA